MKKLILAVMLFALIGTAQAAVELDGDSSGAVDVDKGGTNLTTITDGGVMLGSGTSAVTPMAVLTDGQMIVGDGTTDPVAESGATLRTSIGLGSAATRDAEDTMTDGANLPDGAAVKAYGDANWAGTGDLLADGTIPMTAHWSFGAYNILGGVNSTWSGVGTFDSLSTTEFTVSDAGAVVALSLDLTTVLAVADGGTGVSSLASLMAALDAEDWTPIGAVDMTGTSSLLMGPISFEGSTPDDYATTFSITDPTADRTIAVGDFDTEIPAATAVDATGKIIAAGMAANSVDSDSYVDASIDNAHLADSAVDTAELAADAVESTKIADNAVDTEHLADDAVTYAEADGSSKSSTPLADDADDFSTTFVGAYLYGGTFVANLAGDVDLPAPVVGMNFTVITLGDIEVDILPTAGDDLILDGEQLDDNHDASNTGSMGDIIVIQYYDADGWICTSNGWTEVAD